MPWQSLSLAAALGGIQQQANAAINQVQTGVNKLTSQVGKMTGVMNTAITAVTDNKRLLDDLSEAGIYMIVLSPKTGSWVTRLSSAPDPPPNSGYCCGTATIAIAPDLATVANTLEKAIEAVKKPLVAATNIANPFDSEGFEPEDDPEEFAAIDETACEAKDWGEIFAPDTWLNTTLGDIFGGYKEGLTKASNKLSKDAKSVVASINQANKAVHGINRGLNAAKKAMNDALQCGVYNVVLAPASGNWLARLQQESGAPPTNANHYSSGFATIAVASGISDLARKYATMQKIMAAV